MRRSAIEIDGSIELWFSFGIMIDDSRFLDDDGESYHRVMRSDISLVNDGEEIGEETTEKIGYIEVWYIEGSRAIDNGLDIVDLCDSVDQELYEYANSIYVDGFIDKAICAVPLSNDILVLHRIEIDKRFRGKSYGLAISKTICERLGYNCGAILVRPGPLQFSEISEKPEWQEKYDTSIYSSDKKVATSKLKKYWAKLGLCKTNDRTIYCIPQE